MTFEEQVPIIAFVWRSGEISRGVAQMARRTGSRAIFDFSMMDAESLHSFLRMADPDGHVRDIKISTRALMNPSVGRLLQETGVRNLWVECQSPCPTEDFSVIIQRLRALSETYCCFPIIGDLELLATMAREGTGIGRIVLKGCEASGFVSGETTLVLYSAAKKMPRASAEPLDILLWGGIWTPEAAAAFLSTGAGGIVFESVHWLTDLVVMEDSQRQQVAKLRMDSTSLIGLELQVPCRLFNKGNSLAFKEIKALEDRLCAGEITEENRRSFVSEVQDRVHQPLASHFAQDEVIPLGVEAAFAASFTERFGTGTETAVKGFIEEIRNSCRAAGEKRNCFLDSPVAREMGIKYPFIQGAMSCITDVPEFALTVAEAGGLPTIALGLMDAQTRDARLGRLSEIMGGRPYAVNVVSLAENPFRETHLAWIKQHRPRFVWIAGGDLSPIRELLACGIGVAYIAPDGDLLRLALEAGVQYVVCEGYEAGGHVGQHSTLTLAQMVLDLKRREPSLFQNCRVILAGGICNRETAFMAALLGADAIQMGTAYLATQEVVETGALTALYRRMIVESPPGGTVVSGQSTGLRVRSLRTPRVTGVLSLEREFAAGHQDERSFRTRMEEMAAGSLFVAARGVDRRSGASLDEQACLERGQFMSGACAGVISTVQNLESFHRELAEGSLVLRQPFERVGENISDQSSGAPPEAATPSAKAGNGRKPVTHHQPAHERVAITGMSILNSLGKSPEEIWAASVAMKSGIIPVPTSRWDHGCYYDPRPRIPDKTYCKVGAFLDFQVSRTELGIPPQDFRTMTDATRFTMWLADRAIRASGILESDIPRERIGVLISQNSGEAAGTLTNIIIRSYVNDVLAAVKRAVPLTPEQASAIEREVKAGRNAPDDTTLLGRLNCAAAGFVCNRYGFMGPSFSVSAACATSLVAMHCALQMIRNGVIDAAIVGGAEDSLAHLHFLEFSALGALYGLSGRERPAHEASRPFDAERDGMVLGEGGGMIVIERESLARARGARIHAIVTGMGASNNHLGMVESSRVTQEIALRASFRGLPYGPDAVDLVECHATSTRQGDVEEVRALKTVYSSNKRTVLTSFKSQIGHTLGASGINSIIRGVMAMKAGVFPATLNYAHRDPEMGLDGSGLFIAPEPLDWKRRNGQPRRLQVNAFGFGGSNYVVQLEQALDEVDTIMVSPDTEAHLIDETGDGPSNLQGISVFRAERDGHHFRMAVVARSDDEALTVIEGSATLAEAEIVSPKAVRSLAQQGIFISPEDVPVPPLAMVFPGQGTHYAGMGRNLYESFPIIKESMDRAAAAADFDLLHLLFHDREENLQKTRWQQPALFAMETAMARYLVTHGIRPVAMAGHSLGELSALCLAGVYSVEDGFCIVNARARCMDKAAAMNLDPGVMAAVDAPLERLQEMIKGRENIYIGNINSPRQVILSGNTEAVKSLGKALKQQGYRFTLLRVSMAFHSPIMRVIHDELAEFIATIPFHTPHIPVISNTTLKPYPADPGEIRQILMAHLESTVHWMSNVQTLWKDYGIRHFVEVGPGDILSNLIADTLPEAQCIQTCIPPAESGTYTAALAQLLAHGHLPVRGEPRLVALRGSGKTPAPHHPAPIAERPSSSRAPLPDVPVIPDGPATPTLTAAPEQNEHMESLIHIIMDATGYNRDEIQPDMDLRRDLAIRSSRLPVIMDAAERHFGITIELEDFLQVRTVNDIAERISAIVARQKGADGPVPTPTVAPGAAHAGIPEPLAEEASLKRILFGLAPLEPAVSIAMDLRPGESVLLLSPEQDGDIAGKAEDLLKREYGVDTLTMPFISERSGSGAEGHNILTAEGSARAAEKILRLPSLVGMVITLPAGGSEKLAGVPDVSRFLWGLFPLLKAFLRSPTRKFLMLIHSRQEVDTPSRLLTEGLLGLFLSAAQEYPAILFRTLEIDRDTDLLMALRGAFNRAYTEVELIHREGRLFTSQGRLAPVAYRNPPSLNLSPGDVIVMSGGATGISAHLARSLAPFSPRLVFLGRTSQDSAPDNSRAREISQTLADLRASGVEATYHTCDVTDPAAVRAILGKVASRYGRIDGIIHGAGVLRDGFLDRMSPADFALVVDVKFAGAWNLFSAAEGAGLRFFVGLSSVAAIQGNPGQANYAAANRMMSAQLRYLGRKNAAIHFRALMLPPVEGAGMAENPEVREMLKRKGVGYIHAHELAGLFCRELLVAPTDDDWVMFMRTLPAVQTVRRSDINRSARHGELDGGAVCFRPEDFPMMEEISCLDLRREHLEAARVFSTRKDLWIADHRPLKSIPHPLVSAVMMLETFMEAARTLYPHLHVRGVRQVRFQDMIPCPPEIPRSSKILCHRAGGGLREIACEVSLSIQDISPTGRVTDHFTPHCTGQVLLDGGGGDFGGELPGFPFRPDELRTRSVDHKQVLEWYKNRTGLMGRYRVLEGIDGMGPGVVRGRSTYRETSDFAHLPGAHYQYSPYLFEALMQLAGFYMLTADPAEQRPVLPVEIGEMRFLRPCRAGEPLILEARLVAQDKACCTWNARGLDDLGRTIMKVRSMRLQWVAQ